MQQGCESGKVEIVVVAVDIVANVVVAVVVVNVGMARVFFGLVLVTTHIRPWLLL